MAVGAPLCRQFSNEAAANAGGKLQDENAAPDCPKRRSIEVRLVAFF